MTDLTPNMIAAAQGPLSVTADGTITVARSAADLIALDQYLAMKAAALQKGRGLRFTKMILPGQTGTDTGSSGAI